MFVTTPLDPLAPVVTSELMENYLLESPVTAGTELTVVADASGELNVFTLGTGGSVFVFRPDEFSDTGWSQTSTGLPASTQFAAGLTRDGNLIVFAPSGNTVTFVEAPSGPSGIWSLPQTWQASLSSPVVHVKAKQVGDDLFLTLFESVTGDGKSQPFKCTTVAWEGIATPIQAAFDPMDGFVVDSFNVEAVSRSPESGAVIPAIPGFLAFLAPQVFVQMTNQYEAGPHNQDDNNTNGAFHFTSWRPKSPAGFQAIGDLVLQGQGSIPSAADLIATMASVNCPGDPPPIVAASPALGQATTIFHSSGALCSEGIDVFRGVLPGYVSLGDTNLNIDQEIPDSLSLLMLRQDLAVQAFSFTEKQLCVAPQLELCNHNNLWFNMDMNEQVVGAEGQVAFDRITATGFDQNGNPINPGGIAGNGFTTVTNWDGIGTAVFTLNSVQPSTTRLSFSQQITPLDPGVPSAVIEPLFTSATAPVQSYSIADPGASAGQDVNLEVIAVLATGSLCILDRVSQNWVSLDSSPHIYTSASAVYNEQGLVEAFAIDSNQLLYSVRQRPDGTWQPPIQIIASPSQNPGGFLFRSVKAAQAGDGVAFGFAATTDNRLLRLVKNELEEWGFEVIEYQNTGTPVSVMTYTSEIRVRDLAGALRPGAKVKVFAETVTPVRINGRSYLLDPITPVPVTANSGGLVTVVVETAGLATPILKWQTEFKPADKADMAEPNWRVQEKLKVVTGSELSSQFGIEVEAANNVAPYINNAMSLAPARSDARRGARAIGMCEPFPNRIDASALKGKAFQLDFTSGSPVFRYLSKKELEKTRREDAALPDLGLLDFFGDLGDLVNAITQGIATMVKVTIAPLKGLADKVEAAFQVLLDGVKYAFNAVVERIEQVFDLVSSVFEEIAVKFEQIFEWIGFLFQWEDILRTHAVIAGAVNQGIRFTGLVSDLINQRAQQGIEDLRAQLRKSTDEFVKQTLGESVDLQSFKKNEIPQISEPGENNGSNIVLSGFMDNASNVSEVFSERLLRTIREARGPLDTLFAELKRVGENMETNEDLTQAIFIFNQIGEHPDKVLELAFAGMIKLGAAIADIALDLAKGLVNTLFSALQAILDALSALLNEPLNVPFISELYKTVIAPDSTLTVLDLFALILAVPGTVLYKVLFGEAPFPTPQSVEELNKSFTAEWILSKTGLQKDREHTLEDLPEPPRKKLSNAFGGFYGATYAIFGILDGGMDAFPDSPKAVQKAGLVFEWMIAIFSCPWAIDETNNDKFGSKGTGFGNAIWTCSAWVQAALDSAFLLAATPAQVSRPGSMMRNSGKPQLAFDIGLSWALFALVAAQTALGSYPTGLHIGQAFTTTVPGMFEFLKLKDNDPRFLLAQGIIDIFCDEAVFIMQMVIMSKAPEPAIEASYS